MVPAPVERSELPGHRQRSPNSAAPTVGALSRARSALRPLRLGKISGIWPRQPSSLPSRARARRRRFQRARTQTDLHRPARRRCGCWPTSTFLFSGLLFADFGGGRCRRYQFLLWPPVAQRTFGQMLDHCALKAGRRRCGATRRLGHGYATPWQGQPHLGAGPQISCTSAMTPAISKQRRRTRLAIAGLRAAGNSSGKGCHRTI